MIRPACLVFINLALAFALPPNRAKVYRTDYVYNQKTDAFYKLHIESYNRLEAGRVCELEGGNLMLPSSQHDIVQLHAMFKQFPDLGKYVWVAEDGKEHESEEEPAIINLDPRTEDEPSGSLHQCDVLTRSGDVDFMPCYRSLPFICKVEARSAPYNSRCDVYGNDYKVLANVSSCYKIPRVPYSWNQALAECRAEGSHLVVLNSQQEHDAVYQLMNSEPKVQGSEAFWFFHAGFHAETPAGNATRIFRTIFNETLEEAGYSIWSENEPNNAKGNENCGTLFKNNGNLNDATCSHMYGFICEKELTKL